MNDHAWILLGLFMAMLLLLARPMGIYISRVMTMGNHVTWVSGVEKAVFRACGIQRDEEMGWLRYALAVLLFNALGVLAVYALQRLQAHLPLNLAGMANVSADSAFNTAVSFVTNTNWQGYGGEATMSYLTQMLGLAVQNFCPRQPASWSPSRSFAASRAHSAAGIGNAGQTS
jgi:K+-transporting ATPase ATPase A chain